MTRLDRLFVLLESGSSGGTRKAAADQLGDVVRLHPHELPLLLTRVHKCLRSSNWETRVAAGSAVAAILSNVPKVNVKKEVQVKQEPDSDAELVIKEENSEKIKTFGIGSAPKQRLSFATFDLELLTSGSVFLMASEAKVFDGNGTGTKLSQKDDFNLNPAAQRAAINKRLGLDVAEKMGIDTSDIVSAEDLEMEQEQSQIVEPPTPFSSSSSSSQLSCLYDPNLEEELSSRELNLARRRARKAKLRETQSQQNQSQDSNSNCPPSPSQKRLKRADSSFTDSIDFGDDAEAWPLSSWVEILINDMFSPVWEVRHGAATALREVLRHADGVGFAAGPEWIEDLTLRLVSVLALDRFGDFVSDQVVAPVRETCAQALGAAVAPALMGAECVRSLVKMLCHGLRHEPSWEVRHGACLGLKYIFAVRRDLIESLLPSAFPSIFICLKDPVDDVAAVAASALIPVTDLLVETLPAEAPAVVNVLWDSLADLDDLSSACNSIMGLLAALLTFPKARSTLRELDILIPRLWPFLHHSSSSVRKSALLTLQKLTELDPAVSPMSVGPLKETLRHVYQRGLTEQLPDVQNLIPKVWSDLLRSSKSRLDTLLLAACPCFGSWLVLAMQPPRLPIDPNFLIPSINGRKSCDTSMPSSSSNEKTYMGGSGEGDPLLVAGVRLRLTKMLGELASYIVQPAPNLSSNTAQNGAAPDDPLELFVRVLMVHLNSRSALQRSTTSLLIAGWPGLEKKAHPGLCARLTSALTEPVYWDEVALGFSKLQGECRDFVATLRHYKATLPQEVENVGVSTLFNLGQIEALCGEGVDSSIVAIKKPKVVDTLAERRKAIHALWASTTREYNALNVTTLAAVSCAVVSIGESCLPSKLNPVVKPLMDALRREENVLYQKTSANHLCILMELAGGRDSSPNAKILQNLVSYLCSDNASSGLTLGGESEGLGILSLAALTGPEPVTKKMTKQEEAAEYEATKHSMIQKRGGVLGLKSIVEHFGPALPSKVPRLWELTFGVLEEAGNSNSSSNSLQSVIDALVILEIISPSFHVKLYPTLCSQIDKLCDLLSHREVAVRHMGSRCLAVWASLMPDTVMPAIAAKVLPRLELVGNGIKSDVGRQGALEAIWCIVDKLGLDLLPYIVLLVVPVLGRMSDPDESIRLLASLTFATLVRLMPLEGGVPDPPSLPPSLLAQKAAQREFLEQLLNPAKIPQYEITVPISAELRPYQQSGVNWLGFLNAFNLHGILADDMGLGKTLQSICILGSDHAARVERGAEQLPSLVVCPPTLTGHWVYEIEKFISRAHLSPLHYHGPPAERQQLQPKLKSHNLLVASYDIVRNDISFFSSTSWNYVILDEGHIIKNGKTKISKAIKLLKSNHRLILSGTPIQNNVLELWSLFDFLMPGFLGSEKQFSARFGRPILLARDPKASPKDQEAGALAMEALHRQALPFLLRRLKEDVLQDLPPKITQDYYCELSPMQESLYEDFAKSRAAASLRAGGGDEGGKHSHIFQALQYLRKVCNHPKLVLSPQHPKFGAVSKSLAQSKSSLDDIQHSAKLPALKQLLLDCGIGVNSNDAAGDNFSVVGQHRALIFCQLKVMLDILEKDLFRVHMPSVTYLRLDGGVPAGQRHSLVTRFNNDPSIDVLLLTTQVGGLGLNLTGADTVIFVEHDWNPMRDLQAMDRAHRIGQKKVVNVYRLITRGTLEEKIMGLQKFKLMTANTVISQENAAIESMATDQLLDLFVLDEVKGQSDEAKKKEDVGGIVGAYKNVLEALPELWEDKLYEEEYDLSTFIKNLPK